jgi:membrane-bound lytic murein transglycosylase MltF
MKRVLWPGILVFFVVPLTAHAQNRQLSEEHYYARAYAQHYGVSPALVDAIITEESGWHPDAVSDKGAIGLMQVMPSTAVQYGVRNPFDIEENLSAGVRYLAHLIRRFGDLRLAVAAYYCGENHISSIGLNEHNRQILHYVESVESLYRRELTNEAQAPTS